MTETTQAQAPKAKKSVALSGVAAGNTECVPLVVPVMICTTVAMTFSTLRGIHLRI